MGKELATTLTPEQQALLDQHTINQKKATTGVKEVRNEIRVASADAVKKHGLTLGNFYRTYADPSGEAVIEDLGKTFTGTILRLRTLYSLYEPGAEGASAKEQYNSNEVDSYQDEFHLMNKGALEFSGNFSQFKGYIASIKPGSAFTTPEGKVVPTSKIKRKFVMYLYAFDAIYKLFYTTTSAKPLNEYLKNLSMVSYGCQTIFTNHMESNGGIIWFPMDYTKGEDNNLGEFIMARANTDEMIKEFDRQELTKAKERASKVVEVEPEDVSDAPIESISAPF